MHFSGVLLFSLQIIGQIIGWREKKDIITTNLANLIDVVADTFKFISESIFDVNRQLSEPRSPEALLEDSLDGER